MPKIIIIGGGVAGMSAAHELIDRKFEVEIYETSPINMGGKARSEDVTGVAVNPLPGEHGFRFFPGFYKHLTHTLRRIPFGSKNCFMNLVSADQPWLARDNNDPIKLKANFSIFPLKLKIKFEKLSPSPHSAGSTDTSADLTPAEIQFFVSKMIQLFLSSNVRFKEEYEQIGWWYYLEADRFSKAYQKLLVEGLTKCLVAAKAKRMSTRVGGTIILQLLYNIIEPAVPADQILNGPTNDQWINPWYNYLESRGVSFFRNHSAKEILIKDDKVHSIRVYNQKEKKDIFPAGDYYLIAVPLEQMTKLLNDKMIRIDPRLKHLYSLLNNLSWMNGVQYFLKEDVSITSGHITHIDSPWAITSISQIQFWNTYDIIKQSGGLVKGILSIDISDWDAEYKGKSARNCSNDEIASLAYEQIQKSLIINGKYVLPEEMKMIVVDYHIGTSMVWDGERRTNKEPLLVNTVNSWDLMPKSSTFIPNLMLAGDYVRTNTGLATMEAANESARIAVNTIIDISKFGKPFAKVWKLKHWDVFMPYKWYDRKRFEKGLLFSLSIPLWLHLFTIIWGIPCFIIWSINYFINKVFG